MILGAGALLVGLVATRTDTTAHKLVTSRYTYTAHVYPILQQHCGSCHHPDGVAPMSLLSYDEAFPWAQSIKEELVNLRMPPFHAEPGVGALKYGRTLTAREMDILIEWTSGGTPKGEEPDPVAPASPNVGWSLGEPDLIAEMATAFTLDEQTSEAVRDFVLETSLDADRWVRGLEFQPGNLSVVRSAALFIDRSGNAHPGDATDAALPTEGLLALWLPGAPPVALADNRYRLPAGADLVLRLSYKKNWMLEGTSMTDRSRVGLYFGAPPESGPIETLLVDADARRAGDDGQLSFGHAIDRDIDILSLLAETDGSTVIIQVDAVRPDGAREPLLLLNHPDPSWQTRYWFDAPITLPKGSRVEAIASLATAQISGTPGVMPRLLLDVAPTPARRRAAAGRP